MRFLIAFFMLFLLFLDAKSSIEKKIDYSKEELKKKGKKIVGLNSRLDKLAKEIKKVEKELYHIEIRLAALSNELKDKKKIYQDSKDTLLKIKNNRQKLIKKESQLKEQLTILIAKYFSKSLITQDIDIKSFEDVINEEILKSIQKSEKNRIISIKNSYINIKDLLEKERKKIEKLKEQIDTLDKKREKLFMLKQKKEDSFIRLQKKKKEYKRALDRLIKEQNSLRATLNRLKILQKQKVTTTSKGQNRTKIKNYGNSYQRSKTVKYKGSKTIPPLDRFVITKRYGNYIDPIYEIKIFNESIELKPLDQNAKVRNVLNGKVILAKRTPHLNNVVILKHQGGLYTIYANLDKIAPTIKKGKKIKKGYVIGRVSRKLIFEVTKNSYHINPLDLIKIK